MRRQLIHELVDMRKAGCRLVRSRKVGDNYHYELVSKKGHSLVINAEVVCGVPRIEILKHFKVTKVTYFW